VFIRRPALAAAAIVIAAGGSASSVPGRPNPHAARSLMIRTIFAATAIAAITLGAASPAAAQPTTPTPTPPSPSGPTAICNDHTVSFSLHRSGTCSHHGGVAEWCPCSTGLAEPSRLRAVARIPLLNTAIR
jgi:Protein of unknown function (DUF3761)